MTSDIKLYHLVYDLVSLWCSGKEYQKKIISFFFDETTLNIQIEQPNICSDILQLITPLDADH